VITCFSKAVQILDWQDLSCFYCASVEDLSFVPLSVTHAWLVWYASLGQKQKGFLSSSHAHSNALPPSSLPTKRKRKKKKKKRKKRKERNLCKEKGQAWFSATPGVINIHFLLFVLNKT